MFDRSIAILLVACSAFFVSEADAEEGAPERYGPRSNVLGLSLAYQAPLSLDKGFAGGIGVTYTRDYFVSERTAIGIHTALRIFPAEPFHFALGYGVTLKHYVGSYGQTRSDGLYVLYGLLLQLNVVDGFEGSATGHDTRLAVGFDWSATGVSPLLELGYHLTQVRSFGDATIWWPFTELVIGSRF